MTTQFASSTQTTARRFRSAKLPPFPQPTVALLGSFVGLIKTKRQVRYVRRFGWWTYALGLLADACIEHEHYAKALDFLKQAQLRLNAENSERFYAAEIFRLFAEAYLRSNQDLDQAKRPSPSGRTSTQRSPKLIIDKQSLAAWYNSPEYQPLIELREGKHERSRHADHA